MNATAKQEVNECTTAELVGIWNILQWQVRAGLDVGDRVELVRQELAARGVKTVIGKRLKRAAPAGP